MTLQQPRNCQYFPSSSIELNGWSGIVNNGKSYNSRYRSWKIKENRSKQRGEVNSWPNLRVCQIWLKNNLPLGRYGQNCDFSKWRLDDVTDETSHCYREYLIMRKLWRKFGLIWSSRFWVMEEWKFACVCLCICACVRLCEWNTELVIGYIHSLFRYWQNQIMILPTLNDVFMVKLTLEDWQVTVMCPFPSTRRVNPTVTGTDGLPALICLHTCKERTAGNPSSFSSTGNYRVYPTCSWGHSH